jgi:hypothetical protein
MVRQHRRIAGGQAAPRAGRVQHRDGSYRGRDPRDGVPVGTAVHCAADRRGTTLPAAPGDRWFVDETYVKVAGRWVYLYRAIDQFGQVIDVLVAEKRDLATTRRFSTHALDHGPCLTEGALTGLDPHPTAHPPRNVLTRPTRPQPTPGTRPPEATLGPSSCSHSENSHQKITNQNRRSFHPNYSRNRPLNSAQAAVDHARPSANATAPRNVLPHNVVFECHI